MSTDLHIVYSESGEDYGWTLESPQIPGLIGGRSSSSELLRDTDEIIRFAAPGESWEKTFLHEQHSVEDPDGNEYLIRWLVAVDGDLEDEDRAEGRQQVAGRLNAAAQAGFPESERAAQPVLPTSERLLIAVLADDTLGFVEDQLGDGCAVLSQYGGQDVLISIPFGTSGLGTSTGKFSLEELGLTRQSTFAEMYDSVLTHEAGRIDRSVHQESKAIERPVSLSV
ncbi:hypothetical protein RN2511_035840 [Rhodococcus sp. NKCM2511]|uniref:hypothetical protein n=1 Tax=Rhodococcus sp. NKCM2511 TaxID=2766011 RepID=UPI00190FD44F|nr:hypothetical protein [Rhodococcus sp. NKCM2511]GHP18848.1 hypothetical protein RN2511_035840 [Rhodococcus sp. NKCM2511]